jgi:hypothetical protein
VDRPTGEAVVEPAIDGAEEDLARFGPAPQFAVGVEQPGILLAEK